MKFKTFLGGLKIARMLVEDKQHLLKKWLSSFIYNGYDNRDESPALLADLAEAYPFSGTIYDGINFTTKADYDEFLDQTKNGSELTTTEVTKWRIERQHAMRYANGENSYYGQYYGTKPGPDQIKHDNHDFMTGAAGVVVKLIATNGEVIDVTAEKEYESKGVVALLPGTYKIQIIEENLPFVDTVNAKNFRDKFLAIVSLKHDESDKKTRQLFDHIMFNYDQFDTEMSEHLAYLLFDSMNVKWDVSVRDHGHSYSSYFKDKKNALRIELNWNIPEAFFYYHTLLLSKDSEKMEAQMKKILSAIDRDFREKTQEIDWAHDDWEISIGKSLLAATKLTQYEEHVNFISFLKSKVKLVYNYLNSYEETKRINSIEDHQEKQNAIRALGKHIASTLSQLGKLS